MEYSRAFVVVRIRNGADADALQSILAAHGVSHDYRGLDDDMNNVFVIFKDEGAKGV